MELNTILNFFERQIKNEEFSRFKENFLSIDTSDLNLNEDEIIAFDTEDNYKYVGASHDGLCTEEDEGYMSLKYVNPCSEKIRNKKLSLNDFRNRVNCAVIYEEYSLFNVLTLLYDDKIKEIKAKVYESLPSNSSKEYINSFLNVISDRIDNLSKSVDGNDFDILDEQGNYVNIILITLEKLKADLQNLFLEPQLSTASSRAKGNASPKKRKNTTRSINAMERHKKIAKFYNDKCKELMCNAKAEEATIKEFNVSYKTIQRAIKSSN